jgi:hypothetical protein
MPPQSKPWNVLYLLIFWGSLGLTHIIPVLGSLWISRWDGGSHNKSSIFCGDFPWNKPSSCWGTTTMEIPMWQNSWHKAICLRCVGFQHPQFVVKLGNLAAVHGIYLGSLQSWSMVMTFTVGRMKFWVTARYCTWVIVCVDMWHGRIKDGCLSDNSSLLTV